MVVNPNRTDKYLANNSTTILLPQCPVIVIQSNFTLPTRNIVFEGTDINRFILPSCTIKVSTLTIRIQNVVGVYVIVN